MLDVEIDVVSIGNADEIIKSFFYFTLLDGTFRILIL